MFGSFTGRYATHVKYVDAVLLSDALANKDAAPDWVDRDFLTNVTKQPTLLGIDAGQVRLDEVVIVNNGKFIYLALKHVFLADFGKIIDKGDDNAVLAIHQQKDHLSEG
jgi:hypothetical protein